MRELLIVTVTLVGDAAGRAPAERPAPATHITANDRAASAAARRAPDPARPPDRSARRENHTAQQAIAKAASAPVSWSGPSQLWNG
jgi:hypothetical protein